MSRLQRWSRRKRGLAADKGGEAVTCPPGEEHREAEAVSDAEPVREEDLPDPDSLPPGSDITAFMAPGVSAGLRRRALKRLFAADHYAIRDGLDDYDQDFRQTLAPLAERAAERLRRWLDDPADREDDGTAAESREVADDTASSPGDDQRRAVTGDAEPGQEVAVTASPSPDPPLDQGPLARTGKPIKTR